MVDILEACAELGDLISRGRGHFDDERTTQLAVERLLEIIGEASLTLAEETRARSPQVPWRDIGRLRVVLAHHYHRVDPDQVWTIAMVDVPALKRALEDESAGSQGS